MQHEKMYQVLTKEIADINERIKKLDYLYIKTEKMHRLLSQHHNSTQPHYPGNSARVSRYRDPSPGGTLRINNIYFLAFTVSLIFLVSGIAFILFASSLSREETGEYIQVATGQIKFALAEHINEEFGNLRAASIISHDRELLSPDGTFTRLTKRLVANNSYIQVGIADRNGYAMWMEKGGIRRGSLAGEPFIERALQGEQVVTGTRKNAVDGIDVNYYAVPIFDEASGRISGVLFAADPEEEFRNIINHSLYAGKGLAHIIDSQGNYIVKSMSPIVIGIGDNIFDIPYPLTETDKQKLLDNLAMGQAGYFERKIYEADRLVAYSPLGINGWHVFYAVPEYMVSAGLKNVTVGGIVVISAAVLAFIFFIMLIKRVNKKNRNALETMAFIDPLTGQRNYQKFLIDAAEILKNAQDMKYAICYCDIKAFKTINDLFGRETGDRLLRYYSDFLFELTQEGEVFGRITGDIFVSLRKYQSKQEIETRFESAAHRLMVFPETFSRGYRVELFGGVYFINRNDEKLPLNDMMDRAITAEKSAKTLKNGKHLCFYTDEMREQKLWEAEVESTMEAALENNEFQVYLQPKIDIQHGNRIMGAEALVRWISPEKGLIPPGRFIGLFEKNGFITKLDRYVFDTACRNYKETVLDRGQQKYILSVNVSRLGLLQPDFISTYVFMKEQYHIPDGCIELEFTESLAFENHTLFQSIVDECRRNGFLCSLDDFGAGYSSLNILKSIQVDVLKIDGLFFKYGDNSDRGRELVKNIISMAKSLHMKTVAEGIDEEYQVEQLREMGCDAIQGYIFAKPLPMEEFNRFVELWKTPMAETKLF